MTKEQLLTLVNKKIAGQGSQVDSASKLPVILRNLIEKIFEREALSIERLRKYLYCVTFDKLPQIKSAYETVLMACSAYVKDGKLFRNLDFLYDKAASFIVRTSNFEGMAFITGLNEGELTEDKINELPYRIVDGINNNGIMVSVHILFNDWEYTGAGEKSFHLTRLPYEVLSRVKSMNTIAQDLSDVLPNISAENMGDYLVQMLITDGTTTYALIPPTEDGESYILADATENPKMSNFRWMNKNEVSLSDEDLQTRPTGIERYNAMPASLESLRFTKCYESPDRLSEFIGIDETTKESTEEELLAIYAKAHELYENRTRDGKTWHTMHSVVYGEGIESLFIQENWDDDIICDCGKIDQIGDLSQLNTMAKSTLVAAINEVLGKIPAGETIPSVTISALESVELSESEAAEAGFTPEVIAMLQEAHNPTVEFSDMCVTFNTVEVISDDLVNQSAIIVHTAAGGGTLYKCILSLYTDGRIVYTVTSVE